VHRIERGATGVNSGELVGGRDAVDASGDVKPKYDLASARRVEALLAAE
jgi:hypothetical protein